MAWHALQHALLCFSWQRSALVLSGAINARSMTMHACLQGFFVPYLTGSIVIVVLAVGSTAPGLLQAVIGLFAQVFPDYRERVLRHEAAHFLVHTLQCCDTANAQHKWQVAVVAIQHVQNTA